MSHGSAKKSGLIGEMIKGLGQLREVRNESPVKIDVTKKTFKG
jgi:hypothetical protein